MMRHMHRKATAVLLLFGMMAGCSLFPSSEERKQINKPIPETYEPLNGAHWNHRYSQELEELRAWQDAKTAFEDEYEPEPGTITTGQSVPEERIQEPQPGVRSQPGDPTLEEDEDSLRISE